MICVIPGAVPAALRMAGGPVGGRVILTALHTSMGTGREVFTLLKVSVRLRGDCHAAVADITGRGGMNVMELNIWAVLVNAGWLVSPEKRIKTESPLPKPL